jgi:hypothetical protein
VAHKPHFVEEALEDLGKNETDFPDAQSMMDAVLTWHGIQGFTQSIMDSVDYCREVKDD